jgi:hypothetical protein
LYFVLDGLIEGAGHVVECEDSGKGKVGVGTVLESERGEADEVVVPILAYGRVDGELEAGSCCDVDRVWEDWKAMRTHVRLKKMERYQLVGGRSVYEINREGNSVSDKYRMG